MLNNRYLIQLSYQRLGADEFDQCADVTTIKGVVEVLRNYDDLPDFNVYRLEDGRYWEVTEEVTREFAAEWLSDNSDYLYGDGETPPECIQPYLPAPREGR